MNSVLGVINLINDKPFLKELTNHRSLATVPFAGRYRLIDFTLSNYMHANISQVAVFTKSKYRSTMNHLRSGKEWELDRSQGGLFILPSVNPERKMKGDLQQFHDHIDFFKGTSANTVIISPGYHIGKIDYVDALSQHKKTNADITIIYKRYEGEPVEKPLYHKCSVNEDGKVTDIDLFTFAFQDDPICLETFIIRKDLFIHLIEESVKNEEYDFLRDIVKAKLQKLSVRAYQFKDYMPFIHSIESFYSSNMAILKPEIIQSYFYKKWNIHTKNGHDEPSKYTADSKVTNSLIANGCEIDGIVENSIIFRGVKVKKGAIVRNSIIMHRSEVEENAHIENVIADKQVKITRGKMLIGKNNPKVIKKSEII